MDWLQDPNAWAALVTLTALEIVLGIDNIIFISILAGKLPMAQQARARTMGLAVAMISRLILLMSLSWIIKLTQPLFTVLDKPISGRDLILIVGGLFLIWKSTKEIHQKVEGEEEGHREVGEVTFAGVLGQIMILDVVFSLDSVITAVGMADQLVIMVLAVLISVGIMMLAAGKVSDFVDRHPTVKMLALAFLMMIGVSLIAEGWSLHIPKGYIYFAMAFSILVEMLNIKASKKS